MGGDPVPGSYKMCMCVADSPEPTPLPTPSPTPIPTPVPTPLPTQEPMGCAEEGETCNCPMGLVYFGIKYVYGTPGSGERNDFVTMKQESRRSRRVERFIACTDAAFGGNPAKGKHKVCYCEPA